jgi:hypothetical protein
MLSGPESHRSKRKQARSASDIEERSSLDRFFSDQTDDGFLRFLNPFFVNLLGILRPVLAEREVAFELE